MIGYIIHLVGAVGLIAALLTIAYLLDHQTGTRR
jgi:hypothetical protein